MVSFVCEVCQETLKKAKLDAHFNRCSNAQFTCVDCSTTFHGDNYKIHKSCISEEEKYQKSLYKPKKEKKKDQKQSPLLPDTTGTINGHADGEQIGTEQPNLAQSPKSEPLIPQIRKQSKKRSVETDETQDGTNPKNTTDAQPEKKKKKKKKATSTAESSVASAPAEDTSKELVMNDVINEEVPKELTSEPNEVREKSLSKDELPVAEEPSESTSHAESTSRSVGAASTLGVNKKGAVPVWTRAPRTVEQTLGKFVDNPEIIPVLQSVVQEVFTEKDLAVSLGELTDYICSITAQRLQSQGIVVDPKTLTKLPNYFNLHCMVSATKQANTYMLTIPNQTTPMNDRHRLSASEADTPDMGDDTGLGWVIDKNPTPAIL
ncbi:hypothetical protein SeMB42_g01285 [Synchytrium endobioticum]|uniref:Zinc finger C2H2 LYAR-type domain-containing protein n=1 Tax=Synchytrium endobioticum TaxID=286115 RepID=A0A507CWE8_9FUNG|nr:hypothetical protein SeLEV6574_g05016 [Synchytrium endobioticum]TPX52604.1 hypothetical protein SeMB42_g01285 [Synchytrium endobioticum]